jgi:hypothetical protein
MRDVKHTRPQCGTAYRPAQPLTCAQGASQPSHPRLPPGPGAAPPHLLEGGPLLRLQRPAGLHEPGEARRARPRQERAQSLGGHGCGQLLAAVPHLQHRVHLGIVLRGEGKQTDCLTRSDVRQTRYVCCARAEVRGSAAAKNPHLRAVGEGHGACATRSEGPALWRRVASHTHLSHAPAHAPTPPLALQS